MIKLDEDALVCDLAETYNILDYKQLPASKVAVFSLGLKDSSRIKMKITKNPLDFETMILAGLFDKVSLLLWSKTKDAEKNRNQPNSIVQLISGNKETKRDTIAFTSGEEYEKHRNKLLGVGE